MSTDYDQRFQSEKASGWHQPSEQKQREIANGSAEELQRIRESAQKTW